jgi:(p)ppGpp synthase/HD superfamily hydrolase
MAEIITVTRDELAAIIREHGLWSDEIPRAFSLAKLVHADQRRAGGGPYLEEHIYPVTASVARFLSGRDTQSAREGVLVALLHDAIEDSTTVRRATIAESVGESIARRVAILTKPEKRPGSSPDHNEEAESRYVSGVQQSDFVTRAVKVLDRLNNLAAVQQRDPERRRRYLEETRTYYLSLAESVDQSLWAQMLDLLMRQEDWIRRETSA